MDLEQAASPGPRAMRLATTGTLTHGLPVGEVLRSSTLADARLLAGAAGLGRLVQRLNVMEVPDILPWVKPHELLLTTGYPLRDTPERLVELVAELESRGLAALAIKLGRYLDELPPAMLAEADRLGFPVIRLPDDVGFDDILNQVLTDILNRQAALLARGEEVHRALLAIVLAGGGLAELAEQVAQQLQAAVRVTDPDGRVLAAAPPNDPNDPNAPNPDPAADPTAGWLGVDVVAGGVTHGRIAARLAADARARARTTPTAASDADVQVLERAATVAALVITREQAVTAVESKYRADFLRDVLDGRGGGAGHVVEHAASLGWDLDRPLLVAVAELDGGPAAPDRAAQSWLVETWERAVRRHDPAAATASFAAQVVTLLGAADPARAAATLPELAAAVAAAAPGSAPPRSFSVGISRPVEGVRGLPAAYQQACTALRVGRRVSGGGSCTPFDALGAYRLLSLVPDSAELRSFLTDTLGPLAAPDAAAADLRRTLQVLLETNMNVAETARRLHFHYNTLRYRITKLERTVGPFTTDPALRLSLSLALALIRMRHL